MGINLTKYPRCRSASPHFLQVSAVRSMRTTIRLSQ